jgi:hypothetical protein
MDKEFIPYEQALALKELGFNRRTFATYSTIQNNKWILTPDLSGEGTFSGSGEGQYPKGSSACIAPTFSQAFRFFREKYNLNAEPYTTDMGSIEYSFQIRDLYSEKYVYDNFDGAGSTYTGTFASSEKAELECLKKLIEIVKQK